MAGADRSEADLLISRLRDNPYGFHFFQAVRRLECAHPDRAPIGHSRTPADDPVRFGQEPFLAFSPSTIQGLRPGKPGEPLRLCVAFMGLLGPNGPMPLQLTEHAIRREMAHDEAFARFLDVFHHRMISLFYRAWASAQQAVSFDRRTDPFALYIGSLFGIGMDSLRRRDAVADVAKLHYSGRLVCQTRHAEGLRAILQDYFGVDVTLEQFVGRYIPVPEACLCRLGESPRTGALGRTAIVGSRVWDCQQKFRLRFGRMGLADYERMLPGGDSLERLVAWVRNYTGDELEWDVRLVLKAEEVPQIQLGTLGRVGWSTWLRTKPFESDAEDLVLRPLSQ